MLKTIKLLLLICGILIAKFSMADNKIIIADYMAYPPYIIGDAGLVKEFSALLQEELPDIDFKYQRLSKKRLMVMMEKGTPLIIPLSLKFWFDEGAGLEDSAVLAEEGVYAISHKDNPVSIDEIGVKSLMFLGRVDYKYHVIDDLVNAQKLKRYSCRNENLCLTMVLAGRGDFAVMPEYVFEQYLEQQPKMRTQLHKSKKPLFIQRRSILLHQLDSQTTQTIKQFAKALQQSDKWLSLKAKYQL